MAQCECDYDAQGDPLEYVKVTHNVCPLHDWCEHCLDRLGKKQPNGEWSCDECQTPV